MKDSKFTITLGSSDLLFLACFITLMAIITNISLEIVCEHFQLLKAYYSYIAGAWVGTMTGVTVYLWTRLLLTSDKLNKNRIIASLMTGTIAVSIDLLTEHLLVPFTNSHPMVHVLIYVIDGFLIGLTFYIVSKKLINE